MRHFQDKSFQLIAALCGAVLAGVCFFGNAQGQQNPEVAEIRAQLRFLQQQLAAVEGKNKDLSMGLAEAVRVSTEQTAAAQKVREEMEAFGVDLLSSSKNSLEQRLLKAVRDLNILHQENERQRKAVHGLSEAFLNYLAATPGADEKIRGEANEAIARAGESLKELVDREREYAKRLEKSQVVSIGKDWLVVIDAGRKSGVLVGTPIIIERDEKPIYTAMIVDVRESISGAVLQDKVANSGAVRVGDRIRPFATETDL